MQTIFSRMSLVVVLMIFPVLSFGQGSAAEEARTYLVSGMAAIEMAKSDDELAAAVDEFKKATEIDPTMTAAWYNMGAVQAKLGRFKDAIDSYNHYLNLAPQADDARKIKDEVIKLGYRLEQSEKFNTLSGQWITPDGAFAKVDADNGKLLIRVGRIDFTGSADLWMYDKPVAHPNIYEIGSNPQIRLEARGNKLAGSLEIPGESGFSGWCSLPAERIQVEGTADKGRILLKMKKTKFKVVMNGNDSIFASPKVRCDEVTPTGDMTVDLTLMGPLPKGGLRASPSETQDGTVIVQTGKDSAAGLENGDEIISVDGTDLAQLKTYGEKIMKLRGEPGSEAHLVVKRVVEEGGVFSKEKKAPLNITVRRVAVE
ncbi:MAG TPA: tetratricopeptide repeat protein [Sideroxyarcus sp.]|nr:tetratricopeptide repeat protein [Sideroxyarcus sp.]